MVVGRTDHLHDGAVPNWASPKQGSGLMARHAVTVDLAPIKKNAIPDAKKSWKSFSY